MSSMTLTPHVTARFQGSRFALADLRALVTAVEAFADDAEVSVDIARGDPGDPREAGYSATTFTVTAASL